MLTFVLYKIKEAIIIDRRIKKKETTMGNKFEKFNLDKNKIK